MSEHPFIGIKAKLDRADEAVRTFDRELARFSAAEPVRVGFNANVRTRWNLVYVERAALLPARFAVLVGESLYHCRSSLEHLVWALVQANHRKPGTRHTFPIWDTPRRVKGAATPADAFVQITKRKQLAGVPIAAIHMIEGLQPYNFANPPAFVLSILNRMAVQDRHHALHARFVGARVITESAFTVPWGHRITGFRNLLREGQSVKAGTRIAELQVTPFERPSQVRMASGVPVFLAFGQRKSGMVLIEDIKRISAYLRAVIEPFGRFL